MVRSVVYNTPATGQLRLELGSGALECFSLYNSDFDDSLDGLLSGGTGDDILILWPLQGFSADEAATTLWGQAASSGIINQPLMIVSSEGSDYTGGDNANSLKVIVTYVIVDI